MINPEIFGYFGSALNISMLFPQVYQVVKMKDTKSLSLATMIAFLTACFFWILYGVAKWSWPVIITNVVVGLLNVVLIFLKFKYK